MPAKSRLTSGLLRLGKAPSAGSIPCPLSLLGFLCARPGIVLLRPCSGKHRPSFTIKNIRITGADDADQAIELQAFRSGRPQQASIEGSHEQPEEIALVGFLLEVTTKLVACPDEPNRGFQPRQSSTVDRVQ